MKGSGLHLSFLLLFSLSVAATDFTITLDSQDKFNLTWSYEGTSKEDYITFQITCETTGWVGLGISPNGGMTGADIAVAWVSSDGETFLEDMYASANGLPSLDASNDLMFISSSEMNGITEISYKRKISTCDNNDNTIKSSTTRLIFAYGSTDPVNNILQPSDYHSDNRGAKSIYLLDPQPPTNAVPQDTLTFDLRVNNHEIPSKDTEYYCSYYDPPVLDAKHHIVAVEPLITPGNEGIVHHILIYACWGVENEHIVNNNKTEGECYVDEMPEFADSCRSVFYAWGIGGTKYYFPEEVGFPIGGTEAEGSPQYFHMEMHYDNPQLTSGRRDNSGIRLHYTPTLRNIDAAILSIGDVYGIVVPPQADDYNIVAYCHSTCTDKWIPEGGITLFGYILHAHLLGVGIKVEQFRDGKTIGIVAEDETYDFNYQEVRSFVEPRKVMPGDTLKITCNYNSADRASVTYGGLPSSSEMCLAFLSYYPRQSASWCMSRPSYLFNPEAKIYRELGVDPKLNNESTYVYLEDTFKQIPSWDSDMLRSAQKAEYETSHITRCLKIGGESFKDHFHEFDQSDFVDGVYESAPCKMEAEPNSSVSPSLYVSELLLPLILLAIAQL